MQEMVATELKRIVATLNLTDTQKEQARPEIEAAQKKIAEVQGERQDTNATRSRYMEGELSRKVRSGSSLRSNSKRGMQKPRNPGRFWECPRRLNSCPSDLA